MKRRILNVVLSVVALMMAVSNPNAVLMRN